MSNRSVGIFCFCIVAMMFSALLCRAEAGHVGKALEKESTFQQLNVPSIARPSFPISNDQPSDQSTHLVRGVTSLVNTSFIFIADLSLLLVAIFIFASARKISRVICLTEGQSPFHKLMFGSAIAPNAP